MYIYIFEDGEVKKGDTFGHGDMDSCDDGILDVIDISGDQPMQYYDNEWHDIPSADE